MIAHDPVSQVLTALACFILVYLATVQQSFLALFPAVLLIAGIALQFYFTRQVEVVELTERSTTSLVFYTLVALAGIFIASAAIPFLLPPERKMDLTGLDILLYSVLIAIAEEQFFRGALLNFLLLHVPPALAIPASAAVFMVYHLAVYSLNAYALAYVFVGGAILSWVSVRSGSITPAMLAHILNNVIAVVR